MIVPLTLNTKDFTTTNQRAIKKGTRKVQGVPQSQTAALPRPQEEETSWPENTTVT